MEWSPQDAMKAYLQTLQLCKLHDDDQDLPLGSKRPLIEPQCMEFISALAAGQKAKSMVEITTQGITPLTIALAVAAKQTGAQFLCVLVNNDHNEGLSIDKSKQKLIDLGLEEDVIHFVYKDPFEVLMHECCKDIDFVVVDCKYEHHLELFRVVNVNPRGCIVVEHNIGYRKSGVSCSHVLKAKKRSVGCVCLPIGEGIELKRVGPKGKSERSRRYHVTFEN